VGPSRQPPSLLSFPFLSAHVPRDEAEGPGAAPPMAVAPPWMSAACPWARTPRIARRPSLCPETLAPPYKARPPAPLPVSRRPWGFSPQSRRHQRREEGGEEGREERGGNTRGRARGRPLLPALEVPSRSRRAAALGSHAEPWAPSSTRSWTCRGRGEDCRPGEPATPPLLHLLRCASTLRPGGARRPGTAVPRCTGGGGARRRHCVLALTTGRAMPS
jgi:hypothetical protein